MDVVSYRTGVNIRKSATHDARLGKPLRVTDRVKQHQSLLHLVLKAPNPKRSRLGLRCNTGCDLGDAHRVLVFDQTLVVPAQGY